MWEIKKVISKGDYEYALVPEHPNATKNGYVLLHRIVMENHLGRLLEPNEIVHHKDHNKKNNVVENLEVMDSREHNRQHTSERGRKMVKLKCPRCGTIFVLPLNQTHIQKHSKLGCTCCSKRCRGKLSSQIQHHGLTEELEKAISENIIEEYIEYNT